MRYFSQYQVTKINYQYQIICFIICFKEFQYLDFFPVINLIDFVFLHLTNYFFKIRIIAILKFKFRIEVFSFLQYFTLKATEYFKDLILYYNFLFASNCSFA